MLKVAELGMMPYAAVWEDMKAYTAQRDEQSPDQLWLLEHFPVYTQGQAGKPEHLLAPSPDIPVIQADRGGQITYHGPGQLVAYVLMDLKRKSLGVKTLVHDLERLLITLLKRYDITGETRCNAPGVYVAGKKIASIGLRVRNGCTYHGIALNVNMDLSPFARINPCGFARMEMAQMRDTVAHITVAEVSKTFAALYTTYWGG